MFTDMATISALADSRRNHLLAEAGEYRLAAIAKAGRRALRRAADDAVARLAAQEVHHDRHLPPAEPERAGPSGGSRLSTAGEVSRNRR